MKLNKSLKKILIIDDDPVLVQGIQTVFELENYEVECMTHGNRAFKLIAATHPDLIVLDIKLKEQDGRDIVRQIKTHETTVDIPIILISGVDDIKESALKSGANDFIAKPFSVNELLKRAERQLHPR
ncbi:MAG: response regulator [bacterium]|nr:response regulator [bacterium]